MLFCAKRNFEGIRVLLRCTLLAYDLFSHRCVFISVLTIRYICIFSDFKVTPPELFNDSKTAEIV